MTVRSDRLDLLMSDGSGSHCRMTSESPRKFNIFTAHIVANVSVGAFHFYSCGHAVPKCSHTRAQLFQSICGRNVFQHEIVTLYNWSSLSLMMRSVRLCGSACALPLTP